MTMPAVSVQSLQASAAFLASVVDHNPTPHCKLLAERVVSCINIMLTSNNFKISLLVACNKESIDSGLIDVSNVTGNTETNSAKANITALEKKLTRVSLIVKQVTEVEVFFRSYMSSSWTVRTYVTNEHNENKAQALLKDFDKAVDTVLMELVMQGARSSGQDDDDDSSTTILQKIIFVLNIMLPVLIVIFLIIFVGEKMHLFDDFEVWQRLQQQSTAVFFNNSPPNTDL